MTCRNHIAAIGTIALLFAAPTLAATAGIEDHQRILQTAEAHAEALARAMAPSDATVRVTANRLDSRLRLPACQAEPESFVPAGRSGMPTSIGVRCTVGPAWSMYVPVRVELITNVVVLRNPGARGERLTADQLGLEARDVSRMTNGYLSEIDAVAGMVLRRQVQPGTVLTSALIEKEKIVRRGEQVRLQMGGGVFAVSVTGEALADAASGERVRIRNTDSGRVIEGIAEAPGLVRIGM